MAYDRPAVMVRVVEGLSRGTPLTVLCAEDGMPTPTTIRLWRDEDESFAIAYARAREDGFDAIAEECLAIADDTSNDTRLTGKDEGEREVANTEWITRSRLRVETRLKLLAKWDPRRYGEATTVKHADADGGKLLMDDVGIATRAAALIANALARQDAGTE